MVDSIEEISDEGVLKIMDAWLESHPNPNEIEFFCGFSKLSPRSMVIEARQGTSTGREHLEMFRRLYKESGCESPDEYIKSHYKH